MRHWITYKYPAFTVAFVFLIFILSESNLLIRWDNLFYDVALSNQVIESPRDIVLVAIDDESIAQLGRWPFPRKRHAELIDKLTEAGALAIGFDILFSDADEQFPDNDTSLVAAIGRSQRVVLPVHLEQLRLQGQLRESLPIPPITSQVAALGHIHIELDSDGIARSVYLNAGLGEAFWPSFPLAIAKLVHKIELEKISYSQPPQTLSPHVWVQDFPVRIPFVGPPGTFKRISYSDVLDNHYSADTFEGKFVLVGITASGESDRFPTPVSTTSQLMPGVEVFANILSGLINNSTITEVKAPWRSGLALLPVILLLLVMPRLLPMASALVTLAAALACLLVSYSLLVVTKIWLSPVISTLAILLCYPLWSWFRLESMVKYLQTQITEITERHSQDFANQDIQLEPAVIFLARIIKLQSWVLIDRQRDITKGTGDIAQRVMAQLKSGQSKFLENTLWRELGGGKIVGLEWPEGQSPDNNQLALIDALSHNNLTPDAVRRPLANEAVAQQIGELKALSQQVDDLRHIIDNGLSNMADGLVVVSKFGNILVINPPACVLLNTPDHRKICNTPALDLLILIELENNQSWENLLAECLVHRKEVSASAHNHQGKDIYIQIAPILNHHNLIEALVLNFSDISQLKEAERKRGEILSFLSHDLRSPLVSVLALLEVARGDASNEAHIDLFDRIESYAQLTLHMSDQFVELIRADVLQPHKISKFDLASIAIDAIEQLWDHGHQKQINIISSDDDQEYWMRGDPDLIERAIVNLVSNAIKYSDQNTTIKLSITESDDQLHCSIADQGTGIPSDALPRLFNLYHRVKQPGQTHVKGAGLGLAFVKTVADRHGGEIAVTSELGLGSTFTLSLPRISE